MEEEPETRGGRRRTWDDEHVIKRQFSALVPAFDPRPGRTNIAQTQDIIIPAPGKILDRTLSDVVYGFKCYYHLYCYCTGRKFWNKSMGIFPLRASSFTVLGF